MNLRPGTFLQDRYEILDRIGSGGMSDVYKAMCHKLNRLVAIKVLKEEFSSDSGFVSKFKMEAQAAACLSHPNIVSVYDVVDEGSLHYIVMELIEGITLKNYIHKKGRLDSMEAIGIAIQVAQGIAAAHEQGIVHRDIKPQNIIIARDGKVKVADFGIARAVSAQTLNATAIGSVHYISPEQARGSFSDARSDIYSLGITMYEMVTGKVPFEGENTVSVALAHLEDAITPPSFLNPDIPISLENIILKCTEKKPEYRYESAQAVIADLRRALVAPNEDFVDQQPVPEGGQTVIISEPELKQIRTGRRPVQESENHGYGNGDPYQERRDDRGSQAVSSAGRNAGGSGRSTGSTNKKRREEPDDDITPGIEKILTIAGVAAALLIVAAVIFVFGRLGGLFHSKTPKESETTTIESSTEESISEKQVLMPEVLGLTEDIAREKLKENGGLDMKISSYEFSDTVPSGDVISQSPEMNVVVDKYSAVYVVLSKGPEHVKIDVTKLGLENLTVEEGKVLLESSGLSVTVEEKNSDTVEAGKIINYSPAEAMEGETVTLVASKGPLVDNTVEIPNLAGQTEELAEELLSDSGFVAGEVTEETSEAVPKGLVIRQSIPAGSKAEPGTAVGYVVSSGTAEQAKYRYLASINESYELQDIIGPGSGSTEVNVKIQLRQTVDGKDVVRDLLDPVLIKGDQLLPVSFKNIEGAFGVTSGSVEIVNADTGKVIHSYPLTFVAVPQS